MEKIDLKAFTEDGEFVFRGQSKFIPRIGEKIITGKRKHIVKDVTYDIHAFQEPWVTLVLEEIDNNLKR